VLFKAARVDYIESLLTQRDALEAQVELVETKKQQLSAYVDLYKALGGGWRGSEEKYTSNY
jgi:multidrug efflux system outer membrane protein